MAEIPIRPRARKIVWPWILGLVLILAIIGWMLYKGQNTHLNTESNVPRPAPPVTRVKLAAYWHYPGTTEYRNCLYIQYKEVKKKIPVVIMM